MTSQWTLEESYSSVKPLEIFADDTDFEKQIAAAKDERVEQYLEDHEDNEGSAANHPNAR